MPNRLIKESIWTSPNLNRLSVAAEIHFFRCLVAADDYGCFEATPAILKGLLYPLRLATLATHVEELNTELEECQLIRSWSINERTYAQFIGWDKHNDLMERHTPRTPCPPWLLDENGFDTRIATETLQAFKRIAVAINQLGENATYREIIKTARCSMSTLSKYFKQLRNKEMLQLATLATDATPKNPNHNPNPNHNHKDTGELTEEQQKLFDILLRCPAIKEEDKYKLPELLDDFPQVNHALEFKAFIEWWPGRRQKRVQPWSTLRNWLKKEVNSVKIDKGRVPKEYLTPGQIDKLRAK